MNKIETLPPPPGVLSSLKAGFDAIATNISVILLPLVLDLFLWLGPRLRLDQLFQNFFEGFSRITNNSSSIPPENLIAFQESSTQFLEQLQLFNLLSLLRTFPIGIFSLMSGARPAETPFGAPSVIQVDSGFTLLGLIGLLILIGWFFGGMFFRWVSLIVSDTQPPFEIHFGQSVLQTILLSIVYMILAITIGLPTLTLYGFLVSSNQLIATWVLLILSFLSMWLIVPIFFTPHNIFLNQQNAFSSIYSSLRMARYTMPTSSLFVLIVILLAFGMNFLWNIPSSDELVLTLVGLAGHAFVTTSLLAASFIYYRDMQSWLETVFEKLKTKLPTQKA